MTRRSAKGQKQTHALQQAGLFDHLVGSQQYGGGHRSNVDGSASGAPQDIAGTTARDPVPAKSCPSYRQKGSRGGSMSDLGQARRSTLLDAFWRTAYRLGF